jgi:hypothetical protein
MGLPVFTIEADPENYGFARARFWHKKLTGTVKLLRGDSRSALRELFSRDLRSLENYPLLFYLDAHWGDDLPLAEEIDIIYDRCSSAIVMIDDFQVPFDAGYRYDDYGPGKALTFDYIKCVVSSHHLHAYYPSTPSTAEGGRCRGCVVLAKGSPHRSALASISLLRRYYGGPLYGTEPSDESH